MPLQGIGLITTIQLWLPPFYPELCDRWTLAFEMSVQSSYIIFFLFALALAMSYSQRILSVDPNFQNYFFNL